MSFKEDFLSTYEKKMRKKRFFRDELTYSTKYIDWLESFTEKNGSFSTDTFLYHPEKITETDAKNVENIETLFEAIQEYSDDNYIFPTKVDYGCFYSIQHNGVGYFIGVDYGQGTSFYCVRLDEPEEDALEYKHVMSTVKLPRTIQIDDKLDKLSSLLETLEEEIPLEILSSSVENTFKKIKSKRIHL